jgi:hypothetical protein
LTGAARKRYKTYGILKRLNVFGRLTELACIETAMEMEEVLVFESCQRRSDIGPDKTSFTSAKVAMQCWLRF